MRALRALPLRALPSLVLVLRSYDMNRSARVGIGVVIDAGSVVGSMISPGEY